MDGSLLRGNETTTTNEEQKNLHGFVKGRSIIKATHAHKTGLFRYTIGDVWGIVDIDRAIDTATSFLVLTTNIEEKLENTANMRK